MRCAIFECRAPSLEECRRSRSSTSHGRLARRKTSQTLGANYECRQPQKTFFLGTVLACYHGIGPEAYKPVFVMCIMNLDFCNAFMRCIWLKVNFQLLGAGRIGRYWGASLWSKAPGEGFHISHRFSTWNAR